MREEELYVSVYDDESGSVLIPWWEGRGASTVTTCKAYVKPLVPDEGEEIEMKWERWEYCAKVYKNGERERERKVKIVWDWMSWLLQK